VASSEGKVANRLVAGEAAEAPGGRIGARLIDVHMHYLPAGYRDALAAAGLDRLDGGMPIPDWSEALALNAMDRLGIETAMLSITSPSVRFLDGAAETRLCREVNDAGADLVRRYPGRFGLFATLPLPDPEAALAEIAYAFDALGADGVVMETNIRGMYLGDPELAPVFEELDRRAAVVFLHPTTPACFEKVALGRPAPMIEYPMDTTRTVVDLIYSGALARYDRLRVIVPHGGGALPVLAPRIAAFAGRPYIEPRPGDPAAVFALLRRLYYDTVQSGHPAPLSALREIADPERLLFGTDWPFGPVESALLNMERLAASDMSDTDLALMGRHNAHGLFPRLPCRCGAFHSGQD
jgi:predicted TIM-barrel fold metal-dependent hydrolase